MIATEMQGHGRTAEIDRPIRYESLADGVAGLHDHLGVVQADVVGYSMGGNVGPRLAMRRPELERQLVVISDNARSPPTGWEVGRQSLLELDCGFNEATPRRACQRWRSMQASALQVANGRPVAIGRA